MEHVLVLTEENVDDWKHYRDRFELGKVHLFAPSLVERPVWDQFWTSDVLDTFDLVIVDSWSDTAPYHQENDNAEVKSLIKPVKDLAHQANHAAVLLVHHTAKRGDGGGRGGTTFDATADTRIKFVHKSMKGGSRVADLIGRNQKSDRVPLRFDKETERYSKADDSTEGFTPITKEIYEGELSKVVSGILTKSPGLQVGDLLSRLDEGGFNYAGARKPSTRKRRLTEFLGDQGFIKRGRVWFAPKT